jgi:hypothetical protein
MTQEKKMSIELRAARTIRYRCRGGVSKSVGEVGISFWWALTGRRCGRGKP